MRRLAARCGTRKSPVRPWHSIAAVLGPLRSVYSTPAAYAPIFDQSTYLPCGVGDYPTPEVTMAKNANLGPMAPRPCEWRAVPSGACGVGATLKCLTL